MKAVIKLLMAAAGLLLASHVLAQPYIISPDGTEVTDSKTDLTWRRCSEGKSWNGSFCVGTALRLTNERALIHAQTQTGWRLPNVKELASIIDRSKRSPAIDTTAFPGTVTNWYWSSSPFVRKAGSAWVVFFGTGHVGEGTRFDEAQLRLVR